MKLTGTVVHFEAEETAVQIEMPERIGRTVVATPRLSECTKLEDFLELKKALQNSGEDCTGLDLVFDLSDDGVVVGIEIIR